MRIHICITISYVSNMYMYIYEPANVPPVPVAKVTASTFPSTVRHVLMHIIMHVYAYITQYTCIQRCITQEIM